MDIQIRTESKHRSAIAHRARRSPLQQFRNAVLMSFAGSIAANVMILTVFGMPLALGWHFGLGWLCIAWAVLGVGPLPVRSATGMLVWLAGLIPLIPVSMYDYGYGNYGELLAFVLSIAAPMCVVFWIFRFFCGRFEPVSMKGSRFTNIVRCDQITTKYLFGLTSLCAVAVGVAIPVAPTMFGPESFNFMVALLSVPGILFLPMLFRGTKRSASRPFKHLFLLCLMTTPGVLASCFLFRSQPGDLIMLALLSLLIFFAAGATVIGGLTMLGDWGYQFGCPSEKPQR